MSNRQIAAFVVLSALLTVLIGVLVSRLVIAESSVIVRSDKHMLVQTVDRGLKPVEGITLTGSTESVYNTVQAVKPMYTTEIKVTKAVIVPASLPSTMGCGQGCTPEVFDAMSK